MEKKKRYMFVTRTLADGGAERFVATFSSYLALVGEDVYVVCWNKSANEYKVNEIVKLIYLPDRKESIKRKVQRICDIRNAIERVNPDYVIPFMDAVMFCSMIAMVGGKSKLIYTQRNSPWGKNGNIYTKLLRNIVARKADAIMVQTREQAEFFSKYKEKIWVVPNPVNDIFFDMEKKEYSGEIKKLIMVGRLVQQKNYQLALRCFKRLVTKYPKLELDIYGTGAEKGDLLKLIEQLKLTGLCRLMGRCNQIERKLVQADLFLLTSKYEGMPNALMEAMAIGLPCISSDCKTGPRDLIESEQTGILFENENLESLYQAIEWMVCNPSRAQNMGLNGRKFMKEHYTLANTYKCFVKMCDEIE